MASHGIAKRPTGDDRAAEWLRTFDPSELPMPPDLFVRVLHALIQGLVLQRIPTPELCPDDAFYAAFAAFAPEERPAD